METGAGIASAGFWLFLAVVIASLLWRKVVQRREVLKTVRLAIEKGLPLDDQLTRSLLDARPGKSRSSERAPGDAFLIAGGLLVPVGLGLAFFAYIMAPLPAVEGSAGTRIFVTGAVSVELLAIACLVLWRILARRSVPSRSSSDPAQ